MTIMQGRAVASIQGREPQLLVDKILYIVLN